MRLTLSPELQRLIDERVEAGKYATPEDVVTAAILALDQHEKLGDFQGGELDELLAEGEQSIEREGTLDGDDAYRRRCERRRARD
jgi:antitoxin ParD1/3/4